MKNKKSIKGIPSGIYCHVGLNEVCPYWSINNVIKDKYENGYCSYLEKGDYEINRESQKVMIHTHKNGKYKKTLVEYGPKNPGFFSLLFDQVKDPECPCYDSSFESIKENDK